MESSRRRESIAIVGMACRFPGARTVAEFWRNLVAGTESIRHFSDEELRRAGVEPELLADASYVKASPVLDEVFDFDADFFGFAPAEAEIMDPQQRLMLQTAWEAFEDAGYPPSESKEPVGVFTGSGGVVSSYLAANLDHYPEFIGATGALPHIGNDKDFISTRLSFKLNLTGPSVNVQTACSTSMVAVHLACRSLLDGECDMALAGVSAVRFPHLRGYLARKGDILSPDGHCRAFDADAQGTIFGSGVGAVVLKRLSDAIAGRDRIQAVIRSTAVNNDGAEKVSYTASSTRSQAQAVVEALTLAGVEPDAIGYVECHGTGTAVGDPLEIMALSLAFRALDAKRRQSCRIGSVKTNIGHLEQAAGMASLIKTALLLEHGLIPPLLNFRQPNPAIDFENSPFAVAGELSEWPQEGQRRLALVNCLGLGGTNACCVLEQAPVREPAESRSDAGRHQVLCLSGKTPAALERRREQMSAALAGPLQAADPSEVCFTANAGRVHFPFRLATVGSSIDELRSGLEALGSHVPSRSERPFTVFLFPGQGSHYFAAGRELYDSYAPFRRVLDECSALVREHLAVSILDVLFDREHEALLYDTLYAQPLLFALEYAIARTWESWNVRADAVLGHSVGEIAAACYAGAMSLEAAVKLICERARLMGSLRRRGAMAAVFASAERVEAYLADFASTVSLAAVNAPENTVISGDAAALRKVLSRLTADGITHRRLRVSQAFHSPLLEPILAELEGLAGQLAYRQPALAVLSNVTGQPIESFSAAYWRDHARSPVRFMEGVRTAAGAGASLFVEVGPGTTLTGLARQCLTGGREVWVPTLERARADWETLASALRDVHLAGYPIDWNALYAPWSPRRISLPTYPFEKKRYSLKPRRGRTVRAAGEEAAEAAWPLLGVKIRTGLKESIHQGRYSLARLPFLDDHRIYGLPVLPTAAALDAALCCGQDLAPGERGAVVVSEVTYWEPLILPDDEDLVVQTIATPQEGRGWSFELLSDRGPREGGWRRHVSGHIEVRPPGQTAAARTDLEALRARCPRSLAPAEYYTFIHPMGLMYGPMFRGIGAIHSGEREVLTRVAIDGELAADRHALHPALVDAGLHVFPLLAEEFESAFREGRSLGPGTYLPTGVASFTVCEPHARAAWVHAVRQAGGERSSETMVIDVHLYDDDGRPIAELLGLSLRRMSREMLHPSATEPTREWIYELSWQPAGTAGGGVADETLRGSQWAVFCDGQGVGGSLCRRLEAAGAVCRPIYRAGGNRPPAGAGVVLDPQEAADWADALRGVFTGGPVASWQLVYLWGLDFAPPPEVAAVPAAPDQELCRLTLETLRAVAKVRSAAAAAPQVWIVTRLAQRVEDGQAVDAGQSALWGMGRTFAWEVPPCWGGLLDLDGAGDAESSAERILAEVVADGPSDQRALRGARRLVPRLIRSAHESGADVLAGSLFDRKGIYLVTGGLGSLGVRVAKWLALRGAGHLVLTSRRGGDGHEAALAEIAAAGAAVTVARADVADAEAMQGVFAAIEGLAVPLRGVFHCAGILDDGVIEQMDWRKFKAVTDPKIAGGWILHQLSQRHELDHFILFSSILSLTGSAGQVNYTAGNAFLDGLAEHRRSRGLPCQIVNWGPWDDGGLATASGDVGRAIWRARGVGYIPPEAGMNVLEYLVRSRQPSGAVLLADWSRFLRQFSSTPDFYRELAPQAAAERAQRPNDAAALRRRLDEAAPGRRRDLLVAAVAAEVSDLLGIEGNLDPGRLIADLGMDSLMSVNLLNRLERVLGRPLALAKLLQGPSVLELVDHLYPELLQAAGDGEPQPPAGDAVPRPSAAGAQWLVPLRRNGDTAVRLICFPFAGGGSAAFRRWERWIDPAIELVPVEPPGRLRRIEEEPVRHLAVLIDEVSRAILAGADKPFAFFGHCLGGLTMFEVGRTLIESHGVSPVHAFVSGARPPHLVQSVGPFEQGLLAELVAHEAYDHLAPLHRQSDEVFALALRRFDIPETERMLADAELRSLLLPGIRADFDLSSGYHPPVSFARWWVPFTCLAGEHDAYVSRDQMLEWSRYTCCDFQLHVRPGAHFLMAEDTEFVVGTINRTLCPR